MKERFLVIEGIDGSGKSTVAALLAERLTARGEKVHLTCEPSRGPIGTLLREILSGTKRAPEVFLGYQPGPDLPSLPLLFAADRLDHLQFEINPRLERGELVISDRYYHSSLAYQALAADISWVRTLNQMARVPDRTFILEAPDTIIAARRAARGLPREIYDDTALQLRLARAYRELSRLLPDEPIDYIDASGPPEGIVEEILSRLG